MNLDDQIEAAWKKYRPEALSTNSMALSHDVFTAGYLAALRSMFVEVKPEDVKHRESYWCLTSRGWKVLKWLSGMEWWDCHSETAYRVSDVSMIMDHNSTLSPSVLFTEGRA